jgi:hypothetical protein
MQHCDIQVEGPSDCPTLELVGTLAEFRGDSSAADCTASGLSTDLLGFLKQFKDLFGH